MASSVADFFLGEDPSKVKLPAELEQAQRDRQAAIARIRDIGEGKVESPAVQALRTEGRRGAEDIGRRAEGAVAGTRGAGSLLQARRSQAGAGRAQQRLAGDVASSVGQLLSAEQQQARAQELAGLTDIEQAELRKLQLQQQLADPGFLDVLTTAAGTGAGALLGGKTGAQVGAGLGQATGQAFERRR